ncbi:MAG: hypothetical protein IJY22_01515 [Clostridia bacterium]|nr:hypothetical protein [Clostridia bacterium]
MNQNQPFTPNMGQPTAPAAPTTPNTPAAPAAPAVDKKPITPSLWTGGVMLFMLLFLCVQKISTALNFNSLGGKYMWFALGYNVGVVLAVVLVCVVVANHKRRALGAIGWFLMLAVFAAESIPTWMYIFKGDLPFDDLGFLLSFICFVVDLLCILLLFICAEFLLCFRKRFPAFLAAILSSLELLLILASPVILDLADYSGSLATQNSVMMALYAAIMYLFAGHWLKAVSASMPMVDPYQKIRDRLARSGKVDLATPYGRSSNGALPAAGQTTNAPAPAGTQPAPKQNGTQAPYGRPANTQPTYGQPAQRPAYGQPAAPAQRPAYGQPAAPAQQPAQRPAYAQPQQPAYGQPAQRPAYAQPQQPTYAQPAQRPAYAQPQQPVYAQPAQPVYAQPQQPVYAQPQQTAYMQPAQPSNKDGKWLAGYSAEGYAVYLNAGETVEDAVRQGKRIAFTADGTPFNQ